MTLNPIPFMVNDRVWTEICLCILEFKINWYNSSWNCNDILNTFLGEMCHFLLYSLVSCFWIRTRNVLKVLLICTWIVYVFQLADSNIFLKTLMREDDKILVHGNLLNKALLLPFKVCGFPPSIKTPDKEVTVSKGETAVLKCDVENLYNYKVSQHVFYSYDQSKL